MHVIVPDLIAERVDTAIRQLIPDVRITHLADDGSPDGPLQTADVFLRWWTETTIFRKVLAATPNLRWIHTPSAGVEHLLAEPELMNSDILLTNSAGAHAPAIAEYVLMGMLCHVKQARRLIGLHGEAAWDFEARAQLAELTGKTLLVIGLGAIGREVALRAQAFGVRVIGSRRSPAPIPGVELVVGQDGWRSLLPEADYVLLAVPLTDATRGIIGAVELSHCKPGAYLINVARGQMIDQAALIAALRNGQLSGAMLDVTDPEPAPPDDPIWAAPNVWITPHISASSPRTVERQVALFLENLRRYASGEPLRNLVDREAGY